MSDLENLPSPPPDVVEPPSHAAAASVAAVAVNRKKHGLTALLASLAAVLIGCGTATAVVLAVRHGRRDGGGDSGSSAQEGTPYLAAPVHPADYIYPSFPGSGSHDEEDPNLAVDSPDELQSFYLQQGGLSNVMTLRVPPGNPGGGGGGGGGNEGGGGKGNEDPVDETIPGHLSDAFLATCQVEVCNTPYWLTPDGANYRSVAYTRNSNGDYVRHSLNAWNRLADGSFLNSTCSTFELKEGPSGTKKILTIVVDYDATNLVETSIDNERVVATEFVEAQAQINSEYVAYATGLGIPPIFNFEYTNVVVPASSVPKLANQDFYYDEGRWKYIKAAGWREELYGAACNELGEQACDSPPDGPPFGSVPPWDLVGVANLDPTKPEGGFANYGGRWAYIGLYFLSADRAKQAYNLRSNDFINLARALYSHEVGHCIGWEHDWSSDDTTPFITDPANYGWTDAAYMYSASDGGTMDISRPFAC